MHWFIKLNKVTGRYLKVIFLFILIIFFIFSINKINFLFDLTKFSLDSKKYEKKNLELIAESLSENKRLFELINRYKFYKNELFLSLFIKEMIKQNKVDLLQNESKFFLPIILEKFPENIFLHNLNFYRTKNQREWRNFDLLFFKILEDSKLNFFSFKILTDSIYKGKILKEDLFNLIYFLNWRKNFSLAEDLLNWGMKEKIIDNNQYNFLLKDLIQRKRNKKIKYENNLKNIKNKLKELFGKKNIKIRIKENLIQDGSFTQRDSIKKYWFFSDMSDRKPFSKGSFYGDIDLIENNSIRVMGFFVKRIPGKGPARGGFWYKEKIPLKVKVYLFYFKYKTLIGKEIPSFWLAYEFRKEPRLGSTDFKWKEVFYIFNNKNLKIPKVQPLLRMWGTGSVWFDDIGLFEIEIQGASIEKDILFIE